ncbi:MAG: SpoIIE family protein phosphatase, partial [Chthoniobacteraceae bacterium]
MPLQDESGRIVGTFGLSRDITERRRAEARLAQYAEELRRKNQELEEDLQMARELQDALLPREYPCFPRDAIPRESALHFSHFFNPSAAVSGDFFDILPLSDTSAGIFICDVMGHGVRAALVAAIVRALMEEMRSVAGTPGEFIEHLNAKLCAILKQTEIPMFVSAFYVVADLAQGELRYANAGHPDPVCIRQKGAVRCTENLNGSKRGPVLGMFDGAAYETSQTALSVHDVLLLFTDGLFEVEGSDGELFDQQSLMRAVSQRAHLPADKICTEVLAEIRSFSASDQFSDDVCLVAVEVERLDLTRSSPNRRKRSRQPR